MIQDFVQAAYGWLLSTARIILQLLPILLIAFAAAAGMWVLYLRFDPEDTGLIRVRAAAAWAWLRRAVPLAATLLLLCGAMVQARKMVEERSTTVQQASASRRNEPQLSGVTQYAPSVAVIQDRTYTRTLTLPPQFLERIGSEGVQVLSPYLTDPSAEDVLKLVDSFKRSGQNVVFTRELTRRDEVPVAADEADVGTKFQDRGAGSGERHYEVIFDATYRFHNPTAEQVQMRFNFPPPQGGGTIQGFYFDIAGQRVTEPNQNGLYVWLGNVAPGRSVEAVAHYSVTGGGAYQYMLGSERRRIGKFHMTAAAGSALQFGKSGIYPSKLSGTSAEWTLKDVLTAQSIEMRFPRTDLQAQLLNKTLALLPLVLLLFAVGCLWWFPSRGVGATIAFALGLLAVPMLSGYVTPAVATLAGAAAAVVLGGLALGSRRGAAIAVLCGLLCCIFLTVEHGMLLAWVLALVAVGGLLIGRRRGTLYVAGSPPP